MDGLNNKIYTGFYKERSALFKDFLQKYGELFDIDRLHVWVRNHYQIHCQLDQIAEFLYVSPSKLQNDFKEVHGVSFNSLMKKIAMEKAAVLLEDPSVSVLKVSEEIGYLNPSKFSKAFRKVYKMSPRDYKRRFQKE